MITKDAVTNRPLSGVSVKYEFKDYRTTVTTSSGKATVTQRWKLKYFFNIACPAHILREGGQ